MREWVDKFEEFLAATARKLTQDDRKVLSMELKRISQDNWDDFGQLVLIEVLGNQGGEEPLKRIIWRIGSRIKRDVRKTSHYLFPNDVVDNCEGQTQSNLQSDESLSMVVGNLNEDEMLVANLLLQGYSRNKIAEEMMVSWDRVNTICRQMQRKLRMLENRG